MRAALPEPPDLLLLVRVVAHLHANAALPVEETGPVLKLDAVPFNQKRDHNIPSELPGGPGTVHLVHLEVVAFSRA